MCRSCGCKMYDDDMGSPDTIITKTLNDAAEKVHEERMTLSKKLHEALHDKKGIPELPEERFHAAAHAMGQTTEEAMHEVHESLHDDGIRRPGE